MSDTAPALTAHRTGLDDLPPALAQMQQALEAEFLAAKAAQAQAIEWQGLPPRPFRRPERFLSLWRVLARVPVLGWLWQAHALRRSGLFDAAWYVAHYPDVGQASKDPALHFIRHGAAESRDPGPDFSTGHYLRLYPDVRAAGINPVVHYLLTGWSEGRSVRPGMPDGARP